MTAKAAKQGAKPKPDAKVVMVGLNHKKAPVALRERLAFPPYDMGKSLKAMKQYIPEGVILSTCNRVEIYVAAPDARRAEAAIMGFWSRQCGVPAPEFEEYTYRMVGRRAVQHLFAVASGLDSAVVGEAQILGQVRETLRLGLEHQSMGRVLSALFRQAISAGKRARTETSIGRNAASISSAAVELAREAFGDLQSSRVLLVGAGKMGELAAKNLVDKGAAGIAVVGRSSERAKQLALTCGNAVTLGDMEDALLECDIVISCTSAPHHVIDREMTKRVMKGREGRQIFFIDIAVPRDVEPTAGDIPGVHLYNIDDLESAVAANLKERRKEARKVTPIIHEESDKFHTWLATQGAVPTIVALRDRAEEIRQEEMARRAEILDSLPEEDRQRVEALTLALQKKLLHEPITLLRASAASGEGSETADAVRDLFGLDSDDDAVDGGDD